jgi:isopentenyl-diphosphate delta-isomerase
LFTLIREKFKGMLALAFSASEIPSKKHFFSFNVAVLKENLFIQPKQSRKSMDDEMVDILDEKGTPTGEVKLKREAHAKGLWHRAVHIWIYNSKGEVLLQKRAKNKIFLPGLWDVSAAGHVSAGQSYDEAAVREIQEELGVKVKASQLKKVDLHRVAIDYPPAKILNREYIQVYLLELDKKADDFKLQKEEVEKIRSVTIDRFESEVKDPEKVKQYTPFGDYFFDIIRFLRQAMQKD